MSLFKRKPEEPLTDEQRAAVTRVVAIARGLLGELRTLSPSKASLDALSAEARRVIPDSELAGIPLSSWLLQLSRAFTWV